MREYYISNGTNQLGPYNLEDLKRQNITPNTLVWYEGLEEWKKINEVEELKEFVNKLPPPINKPRVIPPPLETAKKIIQTDYVEEIENKITNQKGKKVYKIAIFLFAILGLITLFSKLYYTEDRKEKANPLDYLVVTSPNGSIEQSRFSYYGNRDNSSAGDVEISGKIANKANKTSYKDFEIEVEFLTQTGTFISKAKVIVYEDVAPNSEIFINKKLKDKAPDNCQKVKWKLLDAQSKSKEK
jgi:hypothetical protein